MLQHDSNNEFVRTSTYSVCVVNHFERAAFTMLGRVEARSQLLSPANLITSSCRFVRPIADGLKSSSQTESDDVIDVYTHTHTHTHTHIYIYMYTC